MQVDRGAGGVRMGAQAPLEARALIRNQGEYWRKFQEAARLREAGRIEEAMPL